MSLTSLGKRNLDTFLKIWEGFLSVGKVLVPRGILIWHQHGKRRNYCKEEEKIQIVCTYQQFLGVRNI